MKEIDKYMTPSEATQKWDLPQDAIKNKLKPSIVGEDTLNEMIASGLIKYFQKPDGQRKEWIVSAEAMEKWFGKRKLTNREVLDKILEFDKALRNQHATLYEAHENTEVLSPERQALTDIIFETNKLIKLNLVKYEEISPKNEYDEWLESISEDDEEK
ncbi:hypothetical protein JOD43_002103 [Pullulanibacillus pueri]|uniref:Uncharacterized protein n=1 Tax=Pullulanibacillus pueri TaxID=1437324 RepID=A0A8J2ZWT8_9BACL|nr:hypothetical protein [Pullulanibacillus pueri]GGH83492.1 hypothetical protein GCM10007096_24440 [Pullulanibacillus pueri]